ncbi:hypothetical protein SH580_00995 [Coraliomargarita algicola]|uniref:Uncharacterized protein n=1 Tax=Coraliomargarita algicola TaxID=3092156 RepID=A0ABZ0RMX9_9BACT|nr:hypothetical protein [Coraliomargarita sp. J2-16]WPJ96277.1 hypothetical protein SH580_00995 [Coraliomargarita sp. J2-16]
MKIRFPNTFLSTVCFLLLAASSLMQAQSPNEQGTVREFSLYAWDTLPHSQLYYQSGNTMSELKVNPGRRSKSYPLSMGKLQLFVLTKDPEGKDDYKLVGEASMMEGAKKMLFVVVANKRASGLPLTMFGINDSLDVFPAGSFRFMNFTSVPMEGHFNGETFRLKPGKTTVVESKKESSGGFLPFYIRTMDGVMLYESRLLGQPAGREIVFITPPTNDSGRVNIRFLPQSLPRAPSTPTM